MNIFNYICQTTFPFQQNKIVKRSYFNWLLLFFSIVISVFVTTGAIAAELGGKGEFELSDVDVSTARFMNGSLDDDGPTNVHFRGQWKVSVLMGEPLKVLSVKWKVGSGVKFKGKHYSSTASPDNCESYIPQKIIDKIEIIDFEIKGFLDTWIHLFINADAMAKSGGLNEYGKTNLTLPSSPDWSEIFIGNLWGLGIPYDLDADHAKNLVKQGISFYRIEISKLEFNKTPVRLWLAKNKDRCKKEEPETVDVVPSEIAQAELNEALDDSASFIDAVTDFVNDVFTSQSDFENELDDIESHRDKLRQERAEVNRQLEIRRQKELKEKLHLEELARIKRQQQAKEDHLFIPYEGTTSSFKYYLKLYGYKKHGQIIIEAEYESVSPFKNGLAKVCKYYKHDNTIRPKFAFINQNNKVVGHWYKSPGGTAPNTTCEGLLKENNEKIYTYHHIRTRTAYYDDTHCGGPKKTRKVKVDIYRVDTLNIEGKLLNSKENEEDNYVPRLVLCRSQ